MGCSAPSLLQRKCRVGTDHQVDTYFYVPDGRLFWREYQGQWSDAGTIESLLRASQLAAEADARGELGSVYVNRP